MEQPISALSFRTQSTIHLQLQIMPPDADWNAFVAEMQALLRESWIDENLRIQLKMSKNSAEELFQRWSTKNSFIISNLITILRTLGNEKLVTLVLEDVKQIESKNISSPTYVYLCLTLHDPLHIYFS